MHASVFGAATVDEIPDGGRDPSGAATLELPNLGDVVGRCRLRRLHGVHASEVVYEAHHLVLDRRVALKLLKPEIAVRADLRSEFVRAGIAASKVRHPHAAEVTEAAEENGRAYLVTEMLVGPCLDAELRRRGKFDMGRASEIVLPICAALAEAHAAGVVHGGVKPGSIVLVASRGRIHPKVVDFGISDVTGPLGARRYMAPEQARGAVIDGHADQYAVAVMMFEMLTGELPYDPSALDESAALIAAVASGRTRRLLDVWPQAPVELDAVLTKAMSPDAASRFATMDRFGRALVPFARSRAVRRFRELVDPGSSIRLPAIREASTEGSVPAVPAEVARPTEPRTPVSGVRAIPSQLAAHDPSVVAVATPSATPDEVRRVAAEPTLILRVPARAMGEPAPNWTRSTELGWLALVFLAIASIAFGWLVSVLAA